MNTHPLSAMELERALGNQLRKTLESISWLEDVRVDLGGGNEGHGFDFIGSFQLPLGPKVTLLVECKADPRPSKVPYVAMEREFADGKTALVRLFLFGAPYVTPRLGEVCEKHGWSWFDLAGNIRLSIPGTIHLERTGKPPVHTPPRPIANLESPESGRVIRALLLPEHAGMSWTQRHLAEHFGELERPIPEPSLGLVNKVVRYLREEAYIEDEEKGVRLNDPLKLLFAWRDAYQFDRHERRKYFTLLQGSRLRDALSSFGLKTGGYAAYASFSAAEFQAPHVRQPKTWIYVRSSEISEFESSVDAKLVDTGENLTVLNPDDEGVFYLTDGGFMGDNRLACTNLVQTYVDLWHSGGRGKEAAEALLEQRLKPEWKARGLKV